MVEVTKHLEIVLWVDLFRNCGALQTTPIVETTRRSITAIAQGSGSLIGTKVEQSNVFQLPDFTHNCREYLIYRGSSKHTLGELQNRDGMFVSTAVSIDLLQNKNQIGSGLQLTTPD